MRNPIGFGASDLVVLALAVLLVVLLLAGVWIAPYARQLARKSPLCMALLFGLTVLLRLALLPQNPTPIPSRAKDFSYLLLGDTLAHLRFANAVHPLHQFFAAAFVLQQPAYASVFPIGQGLALALAQQILHIPWAGVLLLSGVLCALCYWMLRAWVTPLWALAGGLLAVIQFGPLSPWTNGYPGAALSASAGCLVLGSLPRLREAPKMRYGLILGVGLGLEILSEPFEALLLTFAGALYLFFAFRKNPIPGLRPALAAIGVSAASAGLLLLANHAVTHSWMTMPYTLSHDRLPLQPASHLLFFLLPPLLFVIPAFLPNLLQWRFLWLIGTALLFGFGENFAAIACLFVLIGVAGLERLGSKPRICVLLLCSASFVFWFGIYCCGDPDLFAITAYQNRYDIHRGDPQGRVAIQAQLQRTPGQQLVFVRHSPFHPFEEWVHNGADIDSAQTVWANDLGAEENEKLLNYFPHRQAWLFEPDARPRALIPYPTESGPFQTVH
jgi:hypothetical protein